MQSDEPKILIVLVHGVWADGTGWQHVIPDLLDAGYDVTAVQLPLISLENDIATLERVIVAHNGPVVLAAHSYGGIPVTNATNDHPNVKALVYVTSFAPDIGEWSVGTLPRAIVLLVQGIISGGIGGVPVILGAILGIIPVLVKSSPR